MTAALKDSKCRDQTQILVVPFEKTPMQSACSKLRGLGSLIFKTLYDAFVHARFVCAISWRKRIPTLIGEFGMGVNFV